MASPFRDEDLHIELSTDFDTFAGGLEGKAAARAQQIRDLKPVNP